MVFFILFKSRMIVFENNVLISSELIFLESLLFKDIMGK